MSTRFFDRRGLVSNISLLALLSVVAAGCSENAARFADPLFTASVPGSPVAVDKFGNPINGTAYDGVSAGKQLQPSAPRSKQIFPQRVDVVGQQQRQTDVFTARNITRLAKEQNFKPGEFGKPAPESFNTAQQQQAPVYTPPVNHNRPVQQQKLTQISRAPLQQLPTQQQQPQYRENLAVAIPPASQPQDFNDVNEQASLPAPSVQQPAPSIQQPAPSQSLPPVPSQTSQFSSGTEWTQFYSPVPTKAPSRSFAPAKPAAVSDAAGPKAYTPPSGAYTSKIDRTSTSSVARAPAAPKVIRAAVPQYLPEEVDHEPVGSIAAGPAAIRDKTGWGSAGGTRITVRKGDTLYSISRRYGVPVDAISKTNNLKDPSEVKVGRQLIIPTYVYTPDVTVSAPDANKKVREARSYPKPPSAPKTIKADLGISQPLPPKQIQPPAQALPPVVAQVSADASGSQHKVARGDTLSSISRRYNVRLDALRAANGLGTSNVIRVGQVLTVPGLNADQGPTGIDHTFTAGVSPQSRTNPVAQLPTLDKDQKTASFIHVPSPVSRPDTKKTKNKQVARLSVDDLPRLDAPDRPVTPYQRPVVKDRQVASLGDANVAALSGGQFKWPVRGDIVSGFGSDSNGRRNDGINVRVKEGTPVKAAASGEVIYAAEGLAAYGKLVLIRHSNGFVSAYAHNKELKVRRGDKVRQGEVIAKAGKTGAVQDAQVHFEIRDGKVPVDPLAHLPG